MTLRRRSALTRRGRLRSASRWRNVRLMERVLGIGGFFFKAENPPAMKKWYAEHLGVTEGPTTYEEPVWRQDGGSTVFEQIRTTSATTVSNGCSIFVCATFRRWWHSFAPPASTLKSTPRFIPTGTSPGSRIRKATRFSCGSLRGATLAPRNADHTCVLRSADERKQLGRRKDLDMTDRAAASRDWKPFLPILAVQFIGTLGYSIAIPFLVFLVSDFGGEPWTYGVVGATYSACQLVGAPVLGRWSDRVGRRPVIACESGGYAGRLAGVPCRARRAR